LWSGISAEAKVVGYYDLNIKVNGDNQMVMLFLEIYPSLQTPYYGEAKAVIAMQAAAKFSDPAGTRTQDPNIKSVMLYQLSYGIGITLVLFKEEAIFCTPFFQKCRKDTTFCRK
jgi:hypothetical protein